MRGRKERAFPAEGALFLYIVVGNSGGDGKEVIGGRKGLHPLFFLFSPPPLLSLQEERKIILRGEFLQLKEDMISEYCF